MCSDDLLTFRKIPENETPAEAVVAKEKQLQKARGELTWNVYDIDSKLFIIPQGPDSGLQSSFFVLGFAGITLASLAILALAIIKKKGILPLSILNLALSLAILLYLYLGKALTDIGQVKYGYYLFLLNTGALIFISSCTDEEWPDRYKL